MLLAATAVMYMWDITINGMGNQFYAAAYLVAAPTTLRNRLRHVLVATVAVVVSAGWFVLLTLVWPASSRPYIAGSTDNNFMNLVLGYNGFARVLGRNQGGFGAPQQSRRRRGRAAASRAAPRLRWLRQSVAGMVTVVLRRIRLRLAHQPAQQHRGHRDTDDRGDHEHRDVEQQVARTADQQSAQRVDLVGLAG